MGVYKLSTAGGIATPRTNYSSFLAGNPKFVDTSYESIATVTVGGTAQSTINFTSIPSNFKHLQLRGILLTSTSTNPTYQFNSDTGNNYTGHHLWGTGSSANANTQGPNGSTIYFNYNPSTSYPSVFVMDILDYASTTKNKTTKVLAGSDTNGGTAEIALWSSLWNNSATAISSIQLKGNGADFTQYTSVALYGIKG